MNEFTPYEISIIENMTPQNRALIPRFTQEEKHSLRKNVNLGNIHLIQSWLKTKEETEKILFWDKGGKYDDPEWKGLAPLNKTSELMFIRIKSHYEQLRNEAVEIQMRSDLALFSQFNSGLLFTGVAGAVRCNDGGEYDNQGKFFKGVELRCVGSIEENINSITIYPHGSGEFEVHLGSRFNNSAKGIWVNSRDAYSLLQLAKLIDKDLSNPNYINAIKDEAGKTVSLDAKAIRRAARQGKELGYDNDLILYSSTRVRSIEKAIETADDFSRCFYYRFGLETECYKIGKKYGNFFILRNDNFDRFLPDTPVKDKGLVLYTATLECRRCRRELESFRDLARLFPDVTFVLVNLTSPQYEFYERVFGDMGGGDSKSFRNNAVGATPFTIIYVPDEYGILRFAEYYGTEKAEAPPSFEKSLTLFNKYFG